MQLQKIKFNIKQIELYNKSKSMLHQNRIEHLGRQCKKGITYTTMSIAPK